MANNFGIYHSITGTVPAFSWDLEQAYDHLTKPRPSEAAAHQEQQNYKKGSSLVGMFGAYCPTARKKTSADNEISGLVSLDFDKIPKDQVLPFLEGIKGLPYTLMAWPSGSFYKEDEENKGGIKMVVQPELPPINHRSYESIFEAVSDRVKQDIPALAPYWDSKCKDLVRLCFLSYAPDAWLNPDPQTVEITGSRNDLLYKRVCDYAKGGMGAKAIIQQVAEDNLKLQNPLSEEELEDGILRPDTLIKATSNRRRGSNQNIANARDLIRHFLPEEFKDMRWDDFIDNIPGFDWDSDISAIRVAMHEAEYEVSRETVVEAVLAYAKRNGPYHSLWDEWNTYTSPTSTPENPTPLLDKCGKYFCEEPTEVDHAIARLMIEGMVARGYNPGCVFEYMVILLGGQNLYKTTALRLLAGGDRHFGALPSLGSYNLKKEVVEETRCVTIMECAELSGAKKMEINDFKGWIDRTQDRTRLSYRKDSKEYPRQFIVVATTNVLSLPKDPTGMRRFPILKVDKPVEVDKLETDREGLIAEARDKWFGYLDAGNKPERYFVQNEAFWQENAKRWTEGSTNQDKNPMHEFLNNLLDELPAGQQITKAMLKQFSDSKKCHEWLRMRGYYNTKGRVGPGRQYVWKHITTKQPPLEEEEE